MTTRNKAICQSNYFVIAKFFSDGLHQIDIQYTIAIESNHVTAHPLSEIENSRK